jgi:ATP-binding cassette, subfamily B, bacterial
MVLRGFGYNVALKELREALGVGRDGASALQLAREAERRGLEVAPVRVSVDGLADVGGPAILHWGGDHFVVLERVRRDRATIVDPTLGRRHMTFDEVAGLFTGLALALEPGPSFEARRGGRGSAWRPQLRRLLAVPQVRRSVATIVGASFVVALIGLAPAALTAVLVDRVISADQRELLPVVALAIAALVIGHFLTGLIRAFGVSLLGGRFDLLLGSSYFEHLMRVPIRFFQERETGDLVARLASTTSIRSTITAVGLTTVVDVPMMILFLGAVTIVSPIFAMAVVATGALQAVLLLVSSRRIHDLNRRELQAQAEVQNHAVQVLRAMVAIKASASETHVVERWRQGFTDQVHIGLRKHALVALLTSSLATIQLAAPVIYLAAAAVLVMNGSLSLGYALAVISLSASILAPLGSLVSSAQRIQLLRGQFERLEDVFETDVEQAGVDVVRAPALTGRIDVEAVTFRYSKNGPVVLDAMTLHVSAGQKVGIVGPTGCGKSTLALVLAGLLRPDTGRVLVDGFDLQGLSASSVRSQIGFVVQEPPMFSASIREVLTLGLGEVAADRIAWALDVAQLRDDVARMPLGIDTPIGENGSSLSGGQRQRLALARAVVRQPRILILDEATSHLDSETEARIDRALSGLDCTRIVIAHRLGTVADADQIVVVDGGRVVESGTDVTLRRQGGRYAAMVGDRRSGSAGSDEVLSRK